MSFSEEQNRRSRVVVETPTARREVVQTVTAREPERRGISTGTVAIVALTAIALTALIVWALMRPTEDQMTANIRVASQPTPMPQTTIVQVPVPQQQPIAPTTTTTTTQPIIVPVPATTTTSSSSTTTDTSTRSSGTDDLTIQTEIEKKLSEDRTFATLGITVTVIDGKVTLMGTVDTAELKRRAERLVRIKGVKSVDNQITVSGSTTPPE
jgi:hypothetical protein